MPFLACELLTPPEDPAMQRDSSRAQANELWKLENDDNMATTDTLHERKHATQVGKR